MRLLLQKPLVELLKQRGPQTKAALAVMCGLPLDKVSLAVDRLVHRGLAQRVGGGTRRGTGVYAATTEAVKHIRKRRSTGIDLQLAWGMRLPERHQRAVDERGDDAWA